MVVGKMCLRAGWRKERTDQQGGQSRYEARSANHG
jgi:hypothetical protein